MLFFHTRLLIPLRYLGNLLLVLLSLIEEPLLVELASDRLEVRITWFEALTLTCSLSPVVINVAENTCSSRSPSQILLIILINFFSSSSPLLRNYCLLSIRAIGLKRG